MPDSGDPSRRHVIAGTQAGDLPRTPEGLIAFYWQPDGLALADFWTHPVYRTWTAPATAHGLVVFQGGSAEADFTAVPVGFGFTFTHGFEVRLEDLRPDRAWNWSVMPWGMDPKDAGFEGPEAKVIILNHAAFAMHGPGNGWMTSGVNEWGSWRPLRGDAPVELIGGEGADTLEGGSGDDLLRGGAGTDLILGGVGRDRAYGGNGGDTLIGGAGPDVMDGQRGHDSLSGGAGNDVLSGGSGYDTLSGGEGNNVLYGLDGDDLFLAHEGNNVILGGRGLDTLDLSVAPAGARVSLSAGVASWSVPGRSGNFELREMEGVCGTPFADTITGGSGFDLIEGFGGRDRLDGGTGPDRYVLGTGARGPAAAVPDIVFDARGGDTLDLRAFGVVPRKVDTRMGTDGVVTLTVPDAAGGAEVVAFLLGVLPGDLNGTGWFGLATGRAGK